MTTSFAVRSRRPTSQAGRVVGSVWAPTAVLIAVTAFIDVLTGGDDAAGLAGAAVIVGLAGVAALVLFRPPERAVASVLFVNAGVGAGALIVAAAVPYLTTGTLTRPHDAVFEAIAGITTTAMTVSTPDSMGRGILLWRSLTQWLGGFGGLLLLTTVLPFLGTGESRSTALTSLGNDAFLKRVTRALPPLAQVYVGATAVIGLAFAAAGMGAFDAAAHALTTVSTGGFSTRTGSIGAFESPAIEWVGAAAMTASGISVLWWIRLLRRDRSAPSATELVWYLGIVAFGTAVVSAAYGTAIDLDVVRRGWFTAASYVSTTGFVVSDAGRFPPGAQAILMVLIGVGAMSASVGGGFRVGRLMALLSYVGRDLRQQLHTRAVIIVRIGRQRIDEELLRRMLGYQAVFAVTVALGAFGVALSGVDVLESLWAALSAMSNVGPLLGSITPGNVAGTPVLGRAVLAVLMLIGRLEIYPMVVAGAVVAEHLAPARRSRALLRRVTA